MLTSYDIHHTDKTVDSLLQHLENEWIQELWVALDKQYVQQVTVVIHYIIYQAFNIQSIGQSTYHQRVIFVTLLTIGQGIPDVLLWLYNAFNCKCFLLYLPYHVMRLYILYYAVQWGQKQPANGKRRLWAKP